MVQCYCAHYYVATGLKPLRFVKVSKATCYKALRQQRPLGFFASTDGEDDQSEETEEQPVAVTKVKGFKAATAASKRRKAVADKNAEAVAGTTRGTEEPSKTVSRGAKRSQQPVKAAADSEEEQDQQPKKTVGTGKKPKQTGAEASDSEEEEEQHQLKKGAKDAQKPHAAVTKRRAKAKATDAAEEEEQ